MRRNHRRKTLLTLAATAAMLTNAPNLTHAEMAVAPPLSATATPDVYLDPSQPIDKRISDLIGRMTLEEKAQELYHNASRIDRLKIGDWGGWNQCLHGVWSKQPTTLFPTSIAMAATWDTALVHEEAVAISDEARALNNIGARGPNGPHGLVYRAPVINISRDPRWGRINECYGEDPTLTGQIGVAYVRGLQGDNPKYLKLASTLKHFAVNNVEKGRLSLETDVPERALYEFWLPHFRACIVDGQAQSIMASYNGINGFPNAINKTLLTDILKNEWGFQGFVVSDLSGIRHLMDGHHLTDKPEIAASKAILAGTDMDDQEYRDALPIAVKQGLITEEDVNKALTRVLRVAFRLGAFDPADGNPYTKIPPSVIDSPEHRALALKTAHASMVLLTNKDHFLPLDVSKIKSIAVIGPHADHFEVGSYYGATPATVTPLQGIKNFVGANVNVLYAAGAPMVGDAVQTDLDAAVQMAKQADVVVLYLGTSLKIEAEARDRTDLSLPAGQEKLLEAIVAANPKTAVVLMNGGPLSVTWARDHVPSILQAWWAGEEGGNAIADTLFGKYNPGGRLPYTVYESLDQIPPQTEYDVTKGFTYQYFTKPPVFAFGHGLSYTQFAYSNFKLSSKKIAGNGTITVSVDIKNTGKLAGDEVAQIYVHTVKSDIPMPIKKLVGFSRIHLDPSQKTTVRFAIPAEKLTFFDVAKHKFTVLPGAIDVFVGGASDEVRAQGQFSVTSVGEYKP